jgi:hypothetical protein
MNKITVILNDYAANVKSTISYDRSDIAKVMAIWDKPDPRLDNLQTLAEFRGYTRWSELSPNHYRVLITRGLNALSRLSVEDRVNPDEAEVSATNFILLTFMLVLEQRTQSEIEHFRINRFDDNNVTFDYSGSYDVEYDRPLPAVVEPVATPSFKIV